jgi:DNA topoisomerase-2
MDIETKYKFVSPQEAVITKDWAAGTTDIVEYVDYIYTDGKLSIETIKYPPALLKAVIDEPLVNAVDHFIRCYNTADAVTEISIEFAKNGLVTIYNNGRGIEIKKHSISGKYIPQMLFGMLHQGEHSVKETASITGGTNGIGAKLGNCFSKIFVIETLSTEHDFGDSEPCLYIQKWTNNMNNVEPPLILHGDTFPKTAPRTPHTKITMMPDYIGVFKYTAFNDDLYAQLNKIIHTRLVFASAFMHYANSIRGNRQQITLKYNHIAQTTRNMADIAKLMVDNQRIFTTLAYPIAQSDPIAQSAKCAASGATTPSPFTHPWEITVIINDTMPDHLRMLSNVNGMIVRDGAHFKYVMNILREDIRGVIAKELSDAGLKMPTQYFNANVILLMNTQVPGAKWKAQAKDILDIPDNIRKQLAYTIDKKFLSSLSGALRELMLSMLMSKRKKPAPRTKFHEKYKPALLTKRTNFHKYAHDCHLLCTEGDSAESQVRIGLTECLSVDYYGTLSMGGVIMNARKKSKVVTFGNESHVQKMPKLEKNAFINALADITGLNHKYKYNPSSISYASEMKQLRYNDIIICVDQDEDGMNILGLFMSMFERLWPNLFAAGYVKWWQTPLIRLYPKSGGVIQEFYNDDDYNTFCTNNDISIYNAKYYKGLGSHSREEIINMSTKFNQNVCQIVTSCKSHETLEVYYGSVVLKRKIELRKPYVELGAAAINQRRLTHKVLCDEILNNEVNGSQRYNISRKLDNAIDGMNTVGRKIYAACTKKFAKLNTPLKVSQLSGYISEQMDYHHGEESLQKSITGKAFLAPGGKQLPILVPLSQFGTRAQGGKDASSPRYIFTKFNKRINDIIYPHDDYPNLEFTVNDGVRVEPKCYYPIIPMALIESTSIPAHGWKLQTWARNAFDVIKNVRWMIQTTDHSRLFKMTPDTFGWKGLIANIYGVEASFGLYQVGASSGASNKNKPTTITITELPLRIWTEPYIKMLKDKMFTDDIIEDISDKSNDKHVHIIVTLRPGAFERLQDYGTVFSDGIEEYFQLRNTMNVNLNYLGINKEVIEFSSYDDILRYWFPYRQEYYRMRVERIMILFNLKLQMLQNKLRYICSGIVVSRMPVSAQCAKLEAENYVKFNTSVISQNSSLRTKDLTDAILGPSASYKYLLSTTDSGKSDEAIESMRKKIEKVTNKKDEYENLSTRGRFIGAEIWSRELDALENEIKIGRPTRWLYEDFGDKFKFK